MGEVYDPWNSENLACLPASLLQGEVTDTISFLENLNWSRLRLSIEQANVIYSRYWEERVGPLNWMVLDVVLCALALARHPKVPELVEDTFGLGDFDFTGVASRGLLAWHGLPHLHLMWISALDESGFDEMPPAAQDYVRGVDLSGTWERTGISSYFENATTEKTKLMSQAFRKMGMPDSAAALDEAAGWWGKMEAVNALNLPEDAHYAAFDPLYAKWEYAAWRMNDEKNCLLEGISRFAAKHSNELRETLGWTALAPATVAND